MAFPLGALIPIFGKVLDRVLPNREAAAQAKQRLSELEQAGELAELESDTQLALAQLEINKVEASHPTIFVSGWRPAIGWVCGAALASQYILGPLVEWLSGLAGERITWPIMNNGELMGLLVGMLGVGGMRTAEKFKGVATK